MIGGGGGRLRRVIRCLPKDSTQYRYWLEVKLAEHGPTLVVILKNPSTADAERSDPTLGKVEAWARRRGYGTLIVVNLFARRSTKPAALNQCGYAAAVGPENDAFIRKAIRSANTVIVAWGNPNGIEREVYDRRAGEVMRLLRVREFGMVGGLTKRGYPRHGLRWNGVRIKSWVGANLT
jgi:hypothetical protein